MLDRPVEDQSGLSGNFEWALTFALNPLTNSEFPSVLTAFNEQLGLRLVPRRGAIDVLVIDAVSLPTPN
jgi:uncharacterized protein (TIGR03435 family)